jgi:aryl-alcohol dehydrogenase-like predicted oxidoreductase
VANEHPRLKLGKSAAFVKHRKSFFEALHASLKRLQTDYIDLYWLHAWDGLTPVEEVLRSFDDAVRMGKIQYAGISDAPAWVVSQANTLAQVRGWTPFVGLQVEYSLVQRTPERDLLPMAEAFGVGVTAWSPLASGVLSGKYGKASGRGEEKRLDKTPFVQLTERNLAIARAAEEVARALGKTPPQVALNWLRQRHGVIPIVGARKLSQLQDNLGCLSFALPAEQVEKLDAVSQIDLGFPHDFLASEQIKEFMYGGTWALIDRPRTA